MRAGAVGPGAEPGMMRADNVRRQFAQRLGGTGEEVDVAPSSSAGTQSGAGSGRVIGPVPTVRPAHVTRYRERRRP